MRASRNLRFSSLFVTKRRKGVAGHVPCSPRPVVRLFVFVRCPFRALTRRNQYPGLTPRAIGCRFFGAGSSPKGAVENSQGRQPLDPGFLREEP